MKVKVTLEYPASVVYADTLYNVGRRLQGYTYTMTKVVDKCVFELEVEPHEVLFVVRIITQEVRFK